MKRADVATTSKNDRTTQARRAEPTIQKAFLNLVVKTAKKEKMEAHLYNNFFPVLQGNTIHEKTSEYS